MPVHLKAALSLRAAALLALLPCLGCPPADAPSVRLGTGELEWEDLGAELAIIQGPQGGFHLLASARVWGVEPGDPGDLGAASNPTVTFVVTQDGEPILHPDFGPIVQGLSPTNAAPYTHEMIGRRVVLDIASDDELDGADVLLSVTVRDVDGVELSDAAEIGLFPHPFNE